MSIIQIDVKVKCDAPNCGETITIPDVIDMADVEITHYPQLEIQVWKDELSDLLYTYGWENCTWENHYCCQDCYEEANADNIRDDYLAGINLSTSGCDTLEEKLL